jgi:indole-3-glycerol phosphate synthase
LPNSKNIRTIPETQAKARWTAPSGTLGELVAAAEKRAASLESRLGELEDVALTRGKPLSLAAALRGQDVALIAEIKRASPSRGEINPSLDATAQALAYERAGASAISVLTEPDRFKGCDEDLEAAAKGNTIPVLRKDFHVAPAQLFLARALGASAVLIIVRAISPRRFTQMVRAAASMGLEVLAEVRDLTELDRALAAGCRIIGVNNRNLETLEIEWGTAEAIIPRIPPHCIAVAESGYSDRESITAVAACGADAVLVGSFLSSAEDPEGAVRQLRGIRRAPRGA